VPQRSTFFSDVYPRDPHFKNIVYPRDIYFYTVYLRDPHFKILFTQETHIFGQKRVVPEILWETNCCGRFWLAKDRIHPFLAKTIGDAPDYGYLGHLSPEFGRATPVPDARHHPFIMDTIVHGYKYVHLLRQSRRSLADQTTQCIHIAPVNHKSPRNLRQRAPPHTLRSLQKYTRSLDARTGCGTGPRT